VERQAVKTLTDPAAKQVNYTPMDSTVAALRALPVPNPPPTVRASAELRTYRVHAVVTSYKEEADSDIHLAVTDAGVSMIFELISPACLPKGDPLINELGYARNTWLKAHPLGTSFVTVNQAVTVTGVLFFDRIHGQRGVAPNGVEIHPVLTLTLN
jgi:hypothetical protein